MSMSWHILLVGLLVLSLPLLLGTIPKLCVAKSIGVRSGPDYSRMIAGGMVEGFMLSVWFGVLGTVGMPLFFDDLDWVCVPCIVHLLWLWGIVFLFDLAFYRAFLTNTDSHTKRFAMCTSFASVLPYNLVIWLLEVWSNGALAKDMLIVICVSMVIALIVLLLGTSGQKD